MRRLHALIRIALYGVRVCSDLRMTFDFNIDFGQTSRFDELRGIIWMSKPDLLYEASYSEEASDH
jgi:hypothetical protein